MYTEVLLNRGFSASNLSTLDNYLKHFGPFGRCFHCGLFWGDRLHSYMHHVVSKIRVFILRSFLYTEWDMLPTGQCWVYYPCTLLCGLLFATHVRNTFSNICSSVYVCCMCASACVWRDQRGDGRDASEHETGSEINIMKGRGETDRDRQTNKRNGGGNTKAFPNQICLWLCRKRTKGKLSAVKRHCINQLNWTFALKYTRMMQWEA